MTHCRNATAGKLPQTASEGLQMPVWGLIRAQNGDFRQKDGRQKIEPPKPGQPLAKGYPLPMVDHHTERDRCLAIFAKHKAERS